MGQHTKIGNAEASLLDIAFVTRREHPDLTEDDELRPKFQKARDRSRAGAAPAQRRA